MPSVYDLKPTFQSLLKPLVKPLARRGVTPNAITLIAILGSLAVGALLLLVRRWSGFLLLLPAWLCARMALNALDGMMARDLQMATPLGAVLNELGDAISDLGLYLPLAFLYEAAQWPVVAFALGAVLTEFCGVLGRALGGSRHYDGPMGKSDRALVVGALGLITLILPDAFKVWPWVFGVAVLLTVRTCWNRIAKALIQLRA